MMTNSVMPMAKAPTVKDSIEMGKGSLAVFPSGVCDSSMVFKSTFLLSLLML